MTHQIPLTPEAVTGIAADGGRTTEIAPDIAYRTLAIVNVVFVGTPNSSGWVLIDAGLPGTAALIRSAASERFGADTPPAAIVMTHGHFDHTGVLKTLADHWDVTVYAHPLEHPYLNGTSSYPPPDPTVGGGMMSLLSPLFPRGPIDLGPRLRELPSGGSVSVMPGWRWIHTPGHSTGHVSFWRESDRSLIAGDAFITTAQESAYAALARPPEIHGPPMYYTPDWPSARNSVRRLAALDPERAITGHGEAVSGPEFRAALHTLADRFDQVAVPHTNG